MLPHPRYNMTHSSRCMYGLQITAVHAFVLNMLKLHSAGLSHIQYKYGIVHFVLLESGKITIKLCSFFYLSK